MLIDFGMLIPIFNFGNSYLNLSTFVRLKCEAIQKKNHKYIRYINKVSQIYHTTQMPSLIFLGLIQCPKEIFSTYIGSLKINRFSLHKEWLYLQRYTADHLNSVKTRFEGASRVILVCNLLFGNFVWFDLFLNNVLNKIIVLYYHNNVYISYIFY